MKTLYPMGACLYNSAFYNFVCRVLYLLNVRCKEKSILFSIRRIGHQNLRPRRRAVSICRYCFKREIFLKRLKRISMKRLESSKPAFLRATNKSCFFFLSGTISMLDCVRVRDTLCNICAPSVFVTMTCFSQSS